MSDLKVSELTEIQTLGDNDLLLVSMVDSLCGYVSRKIEVVNAFANIGTDGVPYIGATSAVDLGSYDIRANMFEFTTGGALYTDVSGKNLIFVNIDGRTAQITNFS